jgi:hypothetical protein
MFVGRVLYPHQVENPQLTPASAEYVSLWQSVLASKQHPTHSFRVFGWEPDSHCGITDGQTVLEQSAVVLGISVGISVGVSVIAQKSCTNSPFGPDQLPFGVELDCKVQTVIIAWFLSPSMGA